jgi:hypothetical protein
LLKSNSKPGTQEQKMTYQMNLAKTDTFLLEASEPMMLHLILDIGNRFHNIETLIVNAP